MSSSHSEENLLTETQEDAMGRCFFSLSTPLKVSPHHNKTALNLQEDADFLERSWKTHPAFVPLPSCQGCCSLPYLGGQRHSDCLWPAVGRQQVARLTALPDRCTWRFISSWHCFHAGIYLDRFHFPAAEKLSPRKARELMSLQSTVSSSKKSWTLHQGTLILPDRSLSIHW